MHVVQNSKSAVEKQNSKHAHAVQKTGCLTETVTSFKLDVAYLKVVVANFKLAENFVVGLNFNFSVVYLKFDFVA